jgi:uncharacterized protein (TIGR02145 family)
MKIKGEKKLDLMSKLGIFASSLFVTTTAIYIWSPVLGTNAEDSTVSRVQVKNNPVISLTLDTNNLNFSFAPTESGTFSSQAVTATVVTNSITGYELYFSAEDDDTDMTLTGATTVIASDFEGTVTSSTIAKDKWGYSLDNASFSKIPALSAQATIRNINHMPSAAEKVTPVYIGIKASSNLQAGSYTKNVEFSAVAHEIPNLSFGGISNMQEMTPTICNAVTIGESATLTDARDGNTYTVKKLADGHCWMTQNLRIINRELDSTLSDLPSGDAYTIPASDTAFETTYNTSAAYLDNTYGGYYNFYTATAGFGTNSVTSGDSNKSICPKGWRLPTGGNDGEFKTLYAKYNSVSAMMGEPNFVLSGNVSNYSVFYQTAYGYYWSSTIADNNGAYRLDVHNSGVNPVSSAYKYRGLAVRCLAR